MVYLITYDLADESFERDLLDYISGLGGVLITESSYLVVSSLKSSDIVSEIRSIVTNDDIVVYVLALDGWAGYGPQSRNEALRRALG